jgi:hypothetical protein
MGSPVTFKELWSDPSLSKTKYIIREVNSYEETIRLENKLIEAAWKKDGLDIVLNRNSAPRFHPEICIQGGKKSHKLGLGIHGLSKEQNIENGRKGGKISGKKVYELGLGIHSLTSEEKSKAGKIGAKITAERYAKEFTLVSPNGKVICERNLRKFCREHELDPANIRRLLKGNQLSSKGWTRLV